jgi:hypothetical protein
MPDLRLERDAFGRLVLIDVGGQVHVGVVPVRAFPLAAPDEGVALVAADGHEVAWVDRLDDLPPVTRGLLEEELASREFIPEIHAIRSVSSFATPSTWEVATDRGSAQLILKGEEDIRRLGHTALLITDSHGIHFLVRDIQALDRASRRILDRFL